MSNLPKRLTKYGHVTLQIPKIFIFRLILYQILGKVTRFGENWLKNKTLQAKTNWRGGVENSMPPNTFRVKVSFRLRFPFLIAHPYTAATNNRI